MTLGTVDADAEEGSGSAAGQAFGVDPVLIGLLNGDADEIGCRLVGPQPLAGDEIADDGVVGPVRLELLAQPGDESAAAKDEERAFLGADVSTGEALGEIIGKALIF